MGSFVLMFCLTFLSGGLSTPSSLAPSTGPTLSPSHVPTLGPTSFFPTTLPTTSPTLVPTTPTVGPTISPTLIPTTSAPTSSPTLLPTITPTTNPTSPVPTSTPTHAPTSTPTDAPTFTPSYTPTAAPTHIPTSAPTPDPTSAPTSDPTSAPTSDPTSAPSISPTIKPTSQPTATVAPTPTPTQSQITASPTTMTSPSVAPSMTSVAPTSSPSLSPSGLTSLAPSVSPTPSPTGGSNSSALPIGNFQTGCLPFGKYFQRSTIEITSPVLPGGSYGFTYTNQIFLFAGCSAFDSQVVISASRITLTPTSTAEFNLDVFVKQVKATVMSPYLLASFATCAGGNWTTGDSRILNASCVVAGVPIPAPVDCPVLYSTIVFNATSIQIASLYSLQGTNITCSPTQRFTNITTANFALAAGALPTCESISNSSVCAPFIDYPVSVPVCNSNCSNAQCQKLTLEKALFVSVLPQIWSALNSSSCRAGIARLLCSSSYSRCNSPKLLPCSETCDLTSACSAAERETINRLLSLLSISGASQLCTNSTCSPPPALPVLPLAKLADAGPQSTLVPTPVVAYPTCANYDGKACAGLVTYPVYVPENANLYQMEQVFEKQIWFAFGLAPRGACYRAFTELVCATVFNRCDLAAMNAVLAPGGPSVSVPLPRLPCRSLCEAYNASCAAFVSLAPNVLARNCSARSDVAVECDGQRPGKFITTPTGTENYAVNRTVIQATIGLSTSCNSLSEVGASVQAPLECPYPLIIPESPTASTLNNAHCAIPCDAKYKYPWATEAWNSFFGACEVLSFLFSLWTVATYVLFRDRLLRTQTQIYAFHTIVAIMFNSFTGVPAILSNPSKMSSSMCIDNTQAMTVRDPGCAITGVLTAFFTMTSVFFLTAFVLDLWLVVSMRVQKFTMETRGRMAMWTFIGIYGFSAAFAIMAISVGKISPSNLPFCFVNSWVSDFFWICVAGSLFADSVLFCLICRLIFYSNKATNIIGTKSRSVCSRFRRPMVFNVVCLFIFVLVAVSRLQHRLMNDYYKKMQADWFLCRLVRSHVTDEQCSEYPPDQSQGFLWISLLVLFSQGFILSAIFGFSRQNFVLWGRFFRQRVFPKCGCQKYATNSSKKDSLNDSTLRQDSSATGGSKNNVSNGSKGKRASHERIVSSSAKSLRELARQQSSVPAYTSSIALESRAPGGTPPATPMSSPSVDSPISSVSPSPTNAASSSSSASSPSSAFTFPIASSSSAVVSVSDSSSRGGTSSDQSDTPKLPKAKASSTKKPKAPEPLRRALFMPASSKVDFVPFD